MGFGKFRLDFVPLDDPVHSPQPVLGNGRERIAQGAAQPLPPHYPGPDRIFLAFPSVCGPRLPAEWTGPCGAVGLAPAGAVRRRSTRLLDSAHPASEADCEFSLRGEIRRRRRPASLVGPGISPL